MTPPDEPPSNPDDPNWPKPEQPYGQPPADQAPYAPYGQAPYGQPQSYPPQGRVPYGAPSYGGPVAPPHPSATKAMVLGIGALAGLFICGIPIVLAPFAWLIGGRAVKEIDADPGRFSGREQAQAGRIMGIIGTGLLVLGIIAMLGLMALLFASGPDSVADYDSSNSSVESDF